MARFLNRYIRIAGVAATILSVVLCAALAARAANHVIEGKYLRDSGEPQLPPLSVASVSRRSAIERATRDKRGAQLVERNMFCSDCGPALAGDAAGPEPGDGVPVTSLPLELLATNLSRRVESSFATVRNTQSSHQGSFFVGQQIPGAGPIQRVGPTYVLFENRANNRVEQISLLAAPGPGSAPARVATTAAAPDSSPYAEGVNQIDDTTYEVERDLVNQVIANPMKLGARVIPAQKDGKIDGIRLYGIRSSSPLAAIGLRSGDTIHSINGYAIDPTKPDQMLEAYEKLKSADNLSVSLSRRGSPVDLTYRVR